MSSMFFQQLLNGLGIGCTYALIALGYNLIFGVLKVVNLAYGEIFMASAFAVLVSASLLPGQPIIIALVALGVAVVTGFLIHLVAVKPLGDITDPNSPRHLSVLISTLGCSLILQNLAIEAFGGYPRPVPQLVPFRSFNMFGGQVELVLILNLAASLIVMSLLYVFLNRTFAGLRLRALSENTELSLCAGVRVSRDQMFAVTVSSGLAGVAAILITQMIGTVSPYIGLSYGFKGLVVLIVGGTGNMPGTVLIALLLGISEVFTVAYVSSSYRDAIAFALLVALLLIKGAVSGSSLRR
jgi:branched-chain amino acid transport system permease protein